jgi:phosphoenolpyruvate-protein kinase (PTS system EI component)
MFPMVSTLSEVRAAKAVLETAKEELRAEGRPFNAAIQVGIMIEVPAAVIIADHLAREVDFLSIGTNDLTQYLMAADRGNAQVNMLVNALDPAVLRMIKHTIDAAHRATIGAYMCGELASHPLAIPLLVGMGLDELSVGVAAIPEVKARVRDVNRERMAQLVDEVLKQPTAEAVSTTLKTLA